MRRTTVDWYRPSYWSRTRCPPIRCHCRFRKLDNLGDDDGDDDDVADGSRRMVLVVVSAEQSLLRYSDDSKVDVTVVGVTVVAVAVVAAAVVAVVEALGPRSL